MMTDFFRRSEEEEEINENSEISSSNNDKKTELYLSPFEAFYLSFGLGCLVVREEENDELHLTIGKKYTLNLLQLLHFYCKYCIFIALLLQNSTIDCFKKDQPVPDRILPLSNYMLYFFFPNMLDALWRKFNQSNSNFCEEYAVYHHFRSKGWVVKDGTKFGVEFLLYQEGPAFFHAQYSVKIVSEVKKKSKILI